MTPPDFRALLLEACDIAMRAIEANEILPSTNSEEIARLRTLATQEPASPRGAAGPVGDGSIIRACAELVRKACGGNADGLTLTEAECEEMRVASLAAKRDYDAIAGEVRTLRAAASPLDAAASWVDDEVNGFWCATIGERGEMTVNRRGKEYRWRVAIKDHVLRWGDTQTPLAGKMKAEDAARAYATRILQSLPPEPTEPVASPRDGVLTVLDALRDERVRQGTHVIDADVAGNRTQYRFGANQNGCGPLYMRSTFNGWQAWAPLGRLFLVDLDAPATIVRGE